MRYLAIALVLTSLFSTSEARADSKVTLKRKSGLWEVSADSDGHAMPMKMKQCADESTDAQMMQLSEMHSESCKMSSFTKIATGYEFASECQVGGSKVTSKGVFTGDFDSEYTGEISTKIDPPIFGKSESKSTISAKWIGPCPDGMSPGDMQVGDGFKINLEQAKQGAKLAAQAMKNPEMLNAMKNALAGGADNGMAEALKNIPGLAGQK